MWCKLLLALATNNILLFIFKKSDRPLEELTSYAQQDFGYFKRLIHSAL